MSNEDPPQKLAVNPISCEGQAVPTYHKTLSMILIQSIYVGHHNAQTNTNNVNSTFHLLEEKHNIETREPEFADSPEFVVPIMISLLLTRQILNHGFLVVKLNFIIQKVLRSPPTWLTATVGVSVSQMIMGMFRCSHNPVLSSFMNYQRVCNTTGVTRGAGTA